MLQSKSVIVLDHTMEKVVAAFRDVDRELAMVKIQSDWTWLKW